MNENRLFLKYVSQNILGMMGISFYILADTFFIAQAKGADGMTALNLVLPIYSLIFAIGAMIGVGSAIRFKILRARKDKAAEYFFSNAIICTSIIGCIFIIVGMIFSDNIMMLLGADERICRVGGTYTKTFLLFTPFFMLNQVFNAFVRNDGDPSLAMTATLSSSLINIIGDYILMFPLGLGMTGAALATGISPIIGILVCSIHFLSKKNTLHFQFVAPSLRRLLYSCQLGASAFVGEISSGVTVAVLNGLILGLVGNVGIAAYGVVANVALVVMSVFNGISQGTQPLFSDYYGKGNTDSVKKIRKLAVVTAFLFAVSFLILIQFGAESVVAVFNSDHNQNMAVYAESGLKIYFIGFLFAGFNIVGTGFLSATENAGWAFMISTLRGFIAVILCAIVLANLFAMTGVWLSFPAAECITLFVTVFVMRKTIH
ncbi:MAG: MATE family efflux transporter [Lachnospiraceae bacterium]|nr:MATE family efflux transporter [Lachnospiraceae bacterium]